MKNARYRSRQWQTGYPRCEAAANQLVSGWGFYDHQQGHALTLAYTHQFNQNWNLVAEGMQVNNRLLSHQSIGLPVATRERQLQLALRYEL